MTDTLLQYICFFHGRFDIGSVFQLGSCRPRLAPKTMWLIFSADCSPPLTLGSKTPVIIYFSDTFTFFLPAQFTWFPHTIYMAFPLSFVYLKTQVHIHFWYPQLTWPVKGQYVTGGRLVGWGCRIRWLPLCRKVKPSTSVMDIMMEFLGNVEDPL